MEQAFAIQLFEDKKVRCIWDAEQEKYYFSIVDVVSVLTESDYQAARKYWKVLKGRLVKEGYELVTNCYQLKLLAPDGKMRKTDVADMEQLLRLIQSVPSKKAEPLKQWLAEQVGHSVISAERASEHLLPVEEAEAKELTINEEESKKA